jgi:hypothetical protein
MFDTDDVFEPGKLTICLDASAGSSGKGKVASFIADHADTWQFCCNTFSAQAGHWVKLDNGKLYFYQTLNSCAYSDKYQKMYIGPGAAIELPAFFREMEENNIDPRRIGIHPLATIIQDIDAAFERGEVDFDGTPRNKHDGTMKTGSTCHGVGACRARRILRRPDLKIVRDAPELKEFLCDTTEEIMERLDKGQSGLFEIAQGFQLSLMLSGMFPYCTSRNVTVAAGFDDMMLPTRYAGNIILNCRTFPIRINSNKYLDPETNKHLIWEEIEAYRREGREIKIYEGDSGPGYDDQTEMSWEDLTKLSGSPEPIIEMTSVTKLPRRVFTFSKKNLIQAIKYNHTGKRVFVSVNFANYVDHSMSGNRGIITPTHQSGDFITDKFKNWLDENLKPVLEGTPAVLKFIGTGPLTDDMILAEAR